MVTLAALAALAAGGGLALAGGLLAEVLLAEVLLADGLLADGLLAGVLDVGAVLGAGAELCVIAAAPDVLPPQTESATPSVSTAQR